MIATLHPGNVQIVTDRDDHIGAFHAGGQWYEPDLLNDMATVAVPDGYAVDVGCHVGNHTLWLAAACDMYVIAVDPNQSAINQLERSAWLNDLQQRIVTFPVAAGDRAGMVTLVRNQHRNSGDTTVTWDPDGTIPVVTLDSLELPRPVSIMKVDVQGWETAVLVGGVATLTRDRPVVYVEDNDPVAIAEVLAPLGYVKGARFCATPTYRWNPT